jgi:hypothetical protein
MIAIAPASKDNKLFMRRDRIDQEADGGSIDDLAHPPDRADN